MITSGVLERPGRWRVAGLAMLVILFIAPAMPLLQRASGPVLPVLSGAFGTALASSLSIALAAGLTAFLIGWPAGVLAAAYEFRGKRLVLALASLPLLAPSLLWSIGWSVLLTRLGLSFAVSPALAAVLVFSTVAAPLVLIVTWLSCRGLTGSQVDACRLAGGESQVLRYLLRFTAVPAALAAGLGGVLTLSDPAPAQIFGARSAAAQILTSFSALYDFELAARQCIALAVIALLLALPLAVVGGPRIAAVVLARQLRPFRPAYRRAMARVARATLMLFVTIAIVVPATGLVLPLAGGHQFARAMDHVQRTAPDTLFYAAGAGVFAVSLGFLLAFVVGRQPKLRAGAVAVLLAVFALPPAVTALGLVQLAADAPVWADGLLRSRLTVCIALGLRFMPVAAVIGLWAWASMSPSWADAANLYGVSFSTYLRRVLLLFFAPAAVSGGMLVALLATADVGTVLLLHPPGAASLPLAIFTVMANAPEALVASLCLVYLLVSAGLVGGLWVLAGKRHA